MEGSLKARILVRYSHELYSQTAMVVSGGGAPEVGDNFVGGECVSIH